MNNSINILKKHKLRITDCRAEILEHFTIKGIALSHADIEKHFGETYDRVTIYRTLNTFLESGLVHKVPDDAGQQKYAVCHADCGVHVHHDLHVHFKCQKCDSINCLDETPIPEIILPNGFQFKDANFLVSGICNKCAV